jgi:hypothetical protein
MKLGKILEKQAKNGTNGGFSIDKRWTKPHRKRRWVVFTRINTGFPDDRCKFRTSIRRYRVKRQARHGFSRGEFNATMGP